MMSNATAATSTPAKVLALCYALPPALFPQAFQIGRLLAHSAHSIGRVCGPFGQRGDGSTEALGLSPPQIIVPDAQPGWPRLHQLALRVLPFYGSAPDEYRAWAVRAERTVMASGAIRTFAPEAIVSFGEPMSDHLLGKALKKGMGLPWIAHFSDPWADNPFRRAHKLSHRANRLLEGGVVEAADTLIFTSEETRRLLARTYGNVLLEKSRVLPHSFEAALYPQRARAASDQIVVRYLGNFYGIRTPYPLLRAIELTRDCQPGLLDRFQFELIGSIPGWMKLHPLIRRADPKLLRFLPSVPYDISLELMVSADLLLVIDAPAKESVFLPSKLIDYLGARRLIFGIVPPGTSARVIRSFGGLTADPADPEAIAEVLATIAARMNSTRDWSPIASEAQFAEYEVSRVASRFDAIIRDALMQHRLSFRA
jgi:glycosyltransferase involved in cell wall biosynthesis